MLAPLWTVLRGVTCSAVIAACCGAEQAQAGLVVASSRGPDSMVAPIVDQYVGLTVWNERVPGQGGPESDLYYLNASLHLGAPSRLPIAPRRGVPFDVDMGREEAGNQILVYSRCAVEPTPERVNKLFGSKVAISAAPRPVYTAGRGCDVYGYNFDGTEFKLAPSTDGASEMLPSIWNGRIAFVRVYDDRPGRRGRYPYLYTQPRLGGDSERQPGGKRGLSGLPGPTSLDLHDRVLSFVWNYAERSPAPNARLVTEIRMDSVRSSRGRLLGRHSGTDYNAGTYISPTRSEGKIHYGYQRVSAAADQTAGFDSRSRQRLSYDLKTGRKTITSDVPGELLVSMSVDHGVIIYGTANDQWGASLGSRIIQDSFPP